MVLKRATDHGHCAFDDDSIHSSRSSTIFSMTLFCSWTSVSEPMTLVSWLTAEALVPSGMDGDSTICSKSSMWSVVSSKTGLVMSLRACSR